MDELSKKLDEALSSFKKGKSRLYLYIVKNKFDAISRLLREGNTFISLFEHFVECGILPEDGNPESLRQAYRREALKRAKKTETKSHDTQKKANTISSPAITETLPQKEKVSAGLGEEQKVNEDEERVELIRKQLGTVVDTGTSRIIKYSDGSFDFD